MCRLLLSLPLLFATFGQALGQEANFDVAAYRTFLDANASLSGAELLEMHDAGTFQDRAGSAPFSQSLYADSIDLKYELTPYELSLIDRHGFMVTERLEPESFGEALKEIYTSHLPVFVSTDAILHALHMSYDGILMTAETQILAPKLEKLLRRLHDELSVLAAEYANQSEMSASLVDLDVYLTVPRHLLEEAPVPPRFGESQKFVDDLLNLVDEEQAADYPLFAENCRHLDFSQFTPRGHYTDDPVLTRYFQAMMWLGRTEIYLTAPDVPFDDPCLPGKADVQRQAIMAALIAELIDRSDTESLFKEIDRIIEMFAGESDNVRLHELRDVLSTTGIERADELADQEALLRMQEELSSRPFAGQKILSQILITDPMAPEQLEPASAFMLFGQRFVIDSYVTSQVVFDRVRPRPRPRLLPSTLDVLFALGNNAAAQFLTPDLDEYNYAPNLAAVRYLIDSYDDSFWDLSLYNGWLGSIRTVNPPDDRDGLPPFMQTAAWWQQKMNTQLASWAQLRHDNLLYAKQSYTAGIGCDFPYTLVEPIPSFYEAVSRFAQNAAERFRQLTGVEGWGVDRVSAFFDNFAQVNDKLAVIAAKQLEGAVLANEEQDFLKRMLFLNQICGQELDGWYTELYFNPLDVSEPDLVVADVHTTPTDESGNMVGWVVHAGTGPLNMAVVTADMPGAGPVAFVGPVMSYYEHVSSNFERLTDEKWETAYAAEPSFRPEFVNVYLADQKGEARGPATMKLATSTETGETPEDVAGLRVAPNYPNPFTSGTTIGFTVNSAAAYQEVDVTVYDVQGRLVKSLLAQTLPAGHYTVEWDGRLASGVRAASGTYVCRVRIGDGQAAQVMTLVR